MDTLAPFQDAALDLYANLPLRWDLTEPTEITEYAPCRIPTVAEKTGFEPAEGFRPLHLSRVVP